MNKKKAALKLIITPVLGLVFVFGLYKLANVFSPGSYLHAEEYDLNYNENQVKDAIATFKRTNPEYVVPKITINHQGPIDLIDKPTEESGHWYTFYFYYKSENKILLTLTRSYSEDKTTIYLVSINSGLDIGNWKEINRDFDKTENEKQKKLFEERILNQIEVILKKH